jgi:hypothetical protein
MWPFNRGNSRQRADIRQTFAAHVSPATVRALMAEPMKTALDVAPRRADVHFVIVQFRDGTVAEMQEAFTRIAEIAIAADGVVESNLSSLALITFGALRVDEAAAANQAKVVVSLMASLGSRVRLVHGQASAFVGLWGGGTRVFYGTVLPDFRAMPAESCRGRVRRVRVGGQLTYSVFQEAVKPG